MIHEWNLPLWDRLQARPGGLPAAILLSGRSGLGKRAFANALAVAALCSDRLPGAYACTVCRSCSLFAAAGHPDYRLLEPASIDSAEPPVDPAASRSRVIGVDRIRDLNGFVAMSSHYGQAKIIQIQPADKLHPSAANALLKMLEEPPSRTVFILVSDRAQQLLPTIRSRCYRIEFPLPTSEAARAWLQDRGITQPEIALAQAGHAPLAAEQMVGEAYWERRRALSDMLSGSSLRASELAKEVPAEELSSFWALLYRWCYDLVAVSSGGAVRYNPDYAQPLSRIAVNLDQHRLQHFVKELIIVARALEHPLNPRLVSERLAIGYTRAVAAQE